jgi:hypothetical protein
MLLVAIAGMLLMVVLGVGYFRRAVHGPSRDADRVLALIWIGLACVTVVLYVDILTA